MRGVDLDTEMARLPLRRAYRAGASAVALLLAVNMAASAEPNTTEGGVWGADERKTEVGPTKYFTGRVLVERLFPPDSDIPVSAAYVTFEPGARSNWHTHPAGQRLLVTSGVGRTQTEGGLVEIIRAGDVIVCPPDTKHWHGAAPNSAMTHLALTGRREGKSVQWLDPVTDKDYEAR